MNTKEAAKLIGVGLTRLYGHLRRETVPAPSRLAGSTVYIWTPEDIRAVKAALQQHRSPTSAN